MPFVETLTGTYGTPGFDDTLDNEVANALQQYRIDNLGEQAFVMQRACAKDAGYDRTPTINGDFIRNYPPFKLLAAMLSHTAVAMDPEAPKGIVPNISFTRSKGTEMNPISRQIDFAMGRSEDVETYHMNGDRLAFTHRHIRIIHAINDAEFSFAKAHLETVHGAVYDMAISAALIPSVQHNVRFYNVGTKIIVLTNRLSVALMYRIFAMMPVIFQIDLSKLSIPVDPAIFDALGNREADKFTAYGMSWLAQINTKNASFAGNIIRRRLTAQIATIKDGLINGLANAYRTEITRKVSEISNAENNLKQLYTNLRTLRMSAVTGNTESAEAFAQFLSKFPELIGIVPANGNPMKFYFAIETTLQHYEVSEAKNIAATCRRRGQLTKALIIEALFVKEEYRVNIRHGFFLNFDVRSRNELYGGWTLGNTPFASRHDAMWNPHLRYFGETGCWGENGPFVFKAITEGNPMVAFNQSLSALRSIWLNDSTAADHLYDDIMSAGYANSSAIIRVEDNKRLTCAEFLKEISEQEDNKKAEVKVL